LDYQNRTRTYFFLIFYILLIILIAFHIACFYGSLKCVELFLKTDIDIIQSRDNFGNVGIHLASINGHNNIINLLLQHQKICILIFYFIFKNIFT
jgi:ankyrin repeat protein